jgi:exopolyphosphatase/guanosine-5'-triphosphate,3'-diphosphate pyrophosphatase
MARVEIGDDSGPEGYELLRADADEVFRTLVSETTEDRRFNPGLDEAHVVSILGTCCVILGIMRRLDLQKLLIAPTIGEGN